ncbi:MAG: ATP-binding protein [Verrucomicrobiota bacterium]
MRKTTDHSFALRNDLDEVTQFTASVEAFGESHQLPGDAVFNLTLALEELVVNVIKHGFEAGTEHEIVVRLRLRENEVLAEIEDDGKPFNPVTDTREYHLREVLHQQPVGGLGVHLVKNLMDSLDYERRGSRNLVRVRKAILPIAA